MTTTINNEHKELNFSSEREQSQACLNSAEHEKNQGRKVLNVPNEREQSQACLNSAEHEKNQGRKVLNVPNEQEQSQACLNSAEHDGLSPKGNVPNLRFPEFQGELEKHNKKKLETIRKNWN